MIVHHCRQRSPEWLALRPGKLTSSAAVHVLKQRQRGSGELEGRATLRRRLLSERLTGLALDGVAVSSAMQHGIDSEDLAIAAYEATTGQLVSRIGFCEHDQLQAGCSPDGLIGTTGVIEVKCPAPTTHVEYLLAGTLPEEYRAQCLHALWLTGASWCDFISFDDRFPLPLDLFIVRLERDAAAMAAYELLVRQFLREVDEAEQVLRARDYYIDVRKLA